jgi:hypothetical protein
MYILIHFYYWKLKVYIASHILPLGHVVRV